MCVYVYSVLATSFSDLSSHVVAGWPPAAPGSHSTILSSSYFSKFHKSPTIALNLPHLAHMPILEPISMANGMDSADWPGLGHVPQTSFTLMAAGVGPNHDSKRQSSDPSKGSVDSSQKQAGYGMCNQAVFSAV